MSTTCSLADGVAQLGLSLPSAALDRLQDFESLLLKWNKTYNLTALRTQEEVRIQHLLDSLAILPWADGKTWLDVGSGGGLPGIPLAICRPDIHFTLVDSVGKKISFLRQAAIELGLNNVTLLHERVESLCGLRFDRISSRAFAQLPRMIELTRALLAPEGRWLAMKGQMPHEELAALPADIEAENISRLEVPGLDAERHLLVLRLRTT